jgi:insecticidal toxin complex protein TccC
VRYSLSDRAGSAVTELDGAGSAVTELDGAGVRVSRETFYPSGGTAAREGKPAYKTKGYAGKERDATGLLHYGFRSYAPWLMRWLNPDPAGTVDGLNLLRMVRNNPVTLGDPDGLAATDEELTEIARQNGVELTAGNRPWLERLHAVFLAPSPPVTLSLTVTPERRVTATAGLPSLNADDVSAVFSSMATAVQTVVTGAGAAPVAAAPAAPALPQPSAPDAGTKKYKCDICSKNYASRSSLSMHKQIHRSEELTCDWPGCEYRTPSKYYLKKHIDNMHINLRPYVCDWPGCEYAAGVKSNLKVHILTHDKIKPFSCDWPGCEYAAGQKAHLQAHILTHDKIRPFACDWPGCEYAAGLKSNLQVHILTHDKIKRFACGRPGCNKSYAAKCLLSRHIRKQHP